MEKKDKRYQGRTLRKVLTYIKAYRLYLAMSLVFAVTTVAATLYIPVLTGRAIDHVLAPGQVNFLVLTKLLWQMGIIILVTALAQWLMNVCNNKITYEVVQDVRREAFAKIDPSFEIYRRSLSWRISKPGDCGRGSVCGWPADGILSAIYRGGHDFRHVVVYAEY